MFSKRLIFLLALILVLLALAPAAMALAPEPDASVLDDVLRGTPYEGSQLSCQSFAMQYGAPGNASAYAIAIWQGKSVLCAFEESGGAWHLRVANENALPANGMSVGIFVNTSYPVVDIGSDTTDGHVMLRFAIDGREGYPYTWPLYSVITPDTELAVSEETGKWTVAKNGKSKFYENRAHERMEDFDLRDFPLTMAAADTVWQDGSQTVYIEKDDSEINASLYKLTRRTVTLPAGQKLPVYSGPGEDYIRGAGGKAAVSTNEPVTVYAAESDWVLISYGVSSGERFGYIPRAAFPAGVSVAYEIYQGSFSVGLTTRNVAVLDNFSEPDKPLCILPYQTPLEVLATLGDWLYVSAGSTESGSRCRGFIPADAFHNTCNF